MSALNNALGRRPLYSVVTPTKMIRRIYDGEAFNDAVVEAPPWWAALIRVASGVPDPKPNETQKKNETED